MAKQSKSVKKKLPSLIDFEKFFLSEADDINTAASVADFLHGAKDIKSSGNEVELAVRNFFARRLANRFYVSNGHIVDHTLQVSTQFDVTIADNTRTPVLYSTRDGSEFITYESVYAVGEVKKNWRKGFAKEFAESIKYFRDHLKREEVNPSYMDVGGQGVLGQTPLTTLPIRNPFFYFAFVVTSQDLQWKELTGFGNTHKDWKILPNVVCLLDRGLLVNINSDAYSQGRLRVNLYPEYVPDATKARWVLIELTDPRKVLGCLYYLVHEHLNSCVLTQPDLRQYMTKMFDLKLSNIQDL